MFIKTVSREPRSCNIACLTVKLVVNGPGVNNFESFSEGIQSNNLHFSFEEISSPTFDIHLIVLYVEKRTNMFIFSFSLLSN